MADFLDDTDMPVENVVEEEANEELLDFTKLLKKKKKKKKKVVVVPQAPAKSGSTPWENDPKRDYSYTELLDRVYILLRERNPQHGGAQRRYVMHPPQLVRVGTKKTMWVNYQNINQLMRRQPEHLMSFILAELGTEGSIDGSHRLVLKGRYIPKQIESLLKKYIREYVTCPICRIPETTLSRDSVTRLFFIQCESCGSRRSVAPIKTGFHAATKSDRRAANRAK